MKVSYLAHVSGKVQGVYFRASCQQLAIDLAISGYANNLDNGDVEVLMCGEESSVEQMLSWLEIGPPEAEVDQVQQKQVALGQYNFFSIN